MSEPILSPCGNCGKPFNTTGAPGNLCMICEVAIQNAEKGDEPQLLRDMRHVQEDKIIETASQKKLKSLQDKNPGVFLAQFVGLERAHAARKKAAAKEVAKESAATITEEDVGTDKCLALVEQWLREKSWEK
jgi:hypothetical protein